MGSLLDRPRRAVRVPTLVAAALAVSGCDSLAPDPIVCTAEARPAVSVTIVDSATNVPRAHRASVILQEGTYVDSVQVPDDPMWEAYPVSPPRSHERAGTYEVRVRREGYRLWTRTGVAVREGPCHVSTVSLTARLEAVP